MCTGVRQDATHTENERTKQHSIYLTISLTGKEHSLYIAISLILLGSVGGPNQNVFSH